MAESLQKEFSNFKKIAQAAGYGVVGFFSYVFGIIWSEFVKNGVSKKIFFSIFEIFKKYYFHILLVIPVIMCFTYSYSVNNVPREERGAKTAITRIVLIFLFASTLLYFLFFRLKTWHGAFFSVLAYCLLYFAIFFFSSMLYRSTKLIDINMTRFSLFYPSILVISINIYFGAVLQYVYTTVYSDLLLFIIGYALLFAYLLFIFLYNYRSIRKKNGSNMEDDQKLSESEKFLKKNYLLFGCYIFVSITLQLLRLIEKMPQIYITINHIIFLSIFVALYLSIFEAWHFSKNYKKIYEGKRNDEIERQTIWINRFLFFFPIIVFLLYPYQTFGLIYLGFFSAGHFFAILYWLKPEKEKVSIARAIFGLLTLIFLIVDILFPIEFDLPVGLCLTTIGFLIPLTTLFFGYVVKNMEFEKRGIFKMIKTFVKTSKPMYLLVFFNCCLYLVLVLHLVAYSVTNFINSKYLFVMYAILVYIIIYTCVICSREKEPEE